MKENKKTIVIKIVLNLISYCFLIFVSYYIFVYVSTIKTVKDSIVKIESIENDKAKIKDALEEEDNFLSLVEKKRLFGSPELDLNLTGILGDRVLIGEEWYVKDVEKNDVKVIFIGDSFVIAVIDGRERQLSIFDGVSKIKNTLRKKGKYK